MSEYSYSSARQLLTQSTALTALVPVNNIRVGFMREPVEFPLITLTQVGGTSYGYLGYKQSSKGSRQRRDDRTIQIDIYSRSGMLDLQQISDKVDLALISGTGFRKVNDNDTYEDPLKAHRKIQTWTFWSMFDD